MDAAKDRPDTVFFALFPPVAQGERAVVVAEEALVRHALAARAVPRERLHVTLVVAGQADEAALPDFDALRRAGAAIACAPFDVAFDRVQGFPPGERACLALGCDDASTHRLRALHDALAAAMRAQGVAPRREGPLQPHLTLAYRVGQDVPSAPIDAIAWRAERFCLLRSLRGQGRYLIEGEWAFGSA